MSFFVQVDEKDIYEILRASSCNCKQTKIAVLSLNISQSKGLHGAGIENRPSARIRAKSCSITAAINSHNETATKKCIELKRGVRGALFSWNVVGTPLYMRNQMSVSWYHIYLRKWTTSLLSVRSKFVVIGRCRRNSCGFDLSAIFKHEYYTRFSSRIKVLLKGLGRPYFIQITRRWPAYNVINCKCAFLITLVKSGNGEMLHLPFTTCWCPLSSTKNTSWCRRWKFII